ncbi:MAG: hypothetical protein AABW80_03815 [Nanoarchaeota archaeon]
MATLERRNFLNFLNEREENVDENCPYIDKLQKTCSIRKISLEHTVFWYCSHADRNGCPHYHWEKELVEKQKVEME